MVAADRLFKFQNLESLKRSNTIKSDLIMGSLFFISNKIGSKDNLHHFDTSTNYNYSSLY